MTRVLVRGLLAAVVQLRQGTYGTDALVNAATVDLLVEEERALAEWAVCEVRNHLATWGAPGTADAYTDEAMQTLTPESLQAYADDMQEAAEAAALAEAQACGRAETRAAEIEALLAIERRQN
jgi:hypothetical protein